MSNHSNEVVNSSPSKKSRFFWRNMGILFSGVAAGILAAVILLVLYAFLTINNHFAVSLANLTQRFDESQQNTTKAEEAIRQTNDTLNSQSQIISDLQKNQRTNKEDFLVAEVFYQVKMANDHLQYENNIPVAIKLLQSADQEMAKLTDPKLYSARQALAADIVALQSAPQVDVAGIYVRLSALNEQIDKLSLITQLLNNRPESMNNVNNDAQPWWRRGLNSMEQALQRIVIVRKNVPNSPPFIAPDQQVFLYQNLHAELLTAQWGLLHHERDVYRLSLLQTIQWIKQYAVADSSVTKQLIQGLTQLQQVDVYPNVPNVTASLQALQSYMKSVGQ